MACGSQARYLENIGLLTQLFAFCVLADWHHRAWLKCIVTDAWCCHLHPSRGDRGLPSWLMQTSKMYWPVVCIGGKWNVILQLCQYSREMGKEGRSMAQPLRSGCLRGFLNMLLTQLGQRLPEQTSHLDKLTTLRKGSLCLLIENHCMQQGISMVGCNKGYWHSPFETLVGCIGKPRDDESMHVFNGFRTILQCQAAGLCHFHLKTPPPHPPPMLSKIWLFALLPLYGMCWFLLHCVNIISEKWVFLMITFWATSGFIDYISHLEVHPKADCQCSVESNRS